MSKTPDFLLKIKAEAGEKECYVVLDAKFQSMSDIKRKDAEKELLSKYYRQMAVASQEKIKAVYALVGKSSQDDPSVWEKKKCDIDGKCCQYGAVLFCGQHRGLGHVWQALADSLAGEPGMDGIFL